MATAENLVRSVSDVVSIEGWSADVGEKLSIHIDAVFRTTAVGGQKDDPVRFRMSLERADLVAINAASEGVRIIPTSVARNRISRTTKITRTRNVESLKSAGFLVKGQAGLRHLIMAINGQLGTTRVSGESQDLVEETVGQGVLVEHRLDAEGMHRWEMFPADGGVLMGSGWDPVEQPRFEIERPPFSPIGRCIIFQVRCLREDIRIEDVEIISPSGESRPLFASGERTKIAAAEAFIKTKLLEVGLISGELNNRFAEICLLETVVEF